MFDNTATFYQRRLTHFSNNRKKKKNFTILFSLTSNRYVYSYEKLTQIEQIESNISFPFFFFIICLI